MVSVGGGDEWNEGVAVERWMLTKCSASTSKPRRGKILDGE